MIGKTFKVKVIFILFIIAAVIFLPEGGVHAKEPQFCLDIDSLNLQKGVSAKLVFSVVNAKGAEVTGIKGIENFDVVSSSQSTSTRIINGDTTYQHDINYIIMPQKTGQFTLQGSVEYDNNTYTTNELTVNVGEADDTQKSETKDLFIKTNISDDEIYFGQKAVLTYELYSRYNIESFGFLDDVSLDGFILNNVSQDNLKSNYTYLEGNKYVKHEAGQIYLSPTKTGTFTIPAFNFQVNVSTGDFFNSSKPVYLQTEPKELNVKALPLKNQPSDFSGIVGKLNLNADYSSQEVNYGDTVTLKVTAFGNCNLESLDNIIKNEIPGFTIYQTGGNMEESIEGSQYEAKKEFEIILVPEKNGPINIAPIYISYFNPETGSYEKAEIPGTTITVNGEIPQNQTQVQNVNNATKTVKIEQVNYEQQNEGDFVIQIKKDQLLIALAVFAIIAVLAAAAFILVSHLKKQDKKLQDIYKELRNTDNQNEIYNLLNSMIKYCYNLSLKASSRDVIINRLADQKIADLVLEIMDYMESGKQQGKGDVYLKNKVKEIYNKLKK